MAKLHTYSYGASLVNISLSAHQLSALQSKLTEVLVGFSQAPGRVGLAAPIYDLLLGVLPAPRSGSDVSAYTLAYDQVHTWIEGAREVNLGEGSSAAYIRNYTAIQYELRFGKGNVMLDDTINVASNSIGIALAQRIISNAGALPSIEGIGAVDGGESARMVFAHPEHYPNGDYTGWAGTLLFPFLGYDRFFREWLLQSDSVNARVDAGAGSVLNRTIKNDVGTYDLMVTLQANEQAISRYSLVQAASALFSDRIDYSQDDLIRATNEYTSRIYGLDKDSPFKLGELLPYVSISTYLTNNLKVRVGTLEDDEMNNYWEKGNHFVVHAGSGDDRIYAPSLLTTAGQALIDGGEGKDTLLLSSRALGLKIKWEPTSQETGKISIYPGYFNIDQIARADAGDYRYQVRAFSVERIEGTVAPDWLRMEQMIRAYDPLYIDLVGARNILDYSAYKTAITLQMSADGLITTGASNARLDIANAQIILGSAKADVMNYKGGNAPLYIGIDNAGYNFKGAQYSWHFKLSSVHDALAANRTHVYGFETLRTAEASDWLSVSGPIQASGTIKVDLGGQGIYGNTLDFSKSVSGIVQSLDSSGTVILPMLGDATLQVLGVRNLVGSAFDDRLVGNNLDNIIDAGAGRNTLWGGGGKDTFVIGMGTNHIHDADSDDRLVFRLPVADSDYLFVARGGFILKAQSNGAENIALAPNQLAFFHPVTPNPTNYTYELGGRWNVVSEDLGREFLIRYSFEGSALKVSTRFLQGDNSVLSSDTYIVDYQPGDLGLTFSELIMPNYTIAASNQGPMANIIERFEEAHLNMIEYWMPPPMQMDVWA